MLIVTLKQEAAKIMAPFTRAGRDHRVDRNKGRCNKHYYSLLNIHGHGLGSRLLNLFVFVDIMGKPSADACLWEKRCWSVSDYSSSGGVGSVAT